MSFEAIKKQEQEYILHSYGRVDVALSHGKNAEAWDVEGKHYYDFTSGIGVNSLSMTPVALDDVRAELAGVTLEEAQEKAAKALNGDFYNPSEWNI